MKHLYTILFLVTITLSTVSAQKSSGEIFYDKKINKERINTYRSGLTAVMDTLFPPIFFEECANEVFSFLNPADWGFVGGNNSFGDVEKAQRFRVEDTDMIRILEIGVFFAERQVVDDGSVSIKIYEVNNETGGPGTLISTSNSLQVSEIIVDDDELAITTFTFDEPPAVEAGEFFASVDLSALYASSDTVAVFMSDVDCGDNDDSWELFADNITWASLADPDLSWNISSNFLMAAIVEYTQTTFTEEAPTNKDPFAFPNPTDGYLRIDFKLFEGSVQSLNILAVDGRRINSYNFKESTYLDELQIDLSEMESGIYLLKVITEKGINTQRISVSR